MRIELLKFLCEDGGYKVLNQVEISGIVYKTYNLAVGIEGEEKVIFSVFINGNRELSIDDTNKFIWRGNFGVSVENGEVEFTEINLREQ